MEINVKEVGLLVGFDNIEMAAAFIGCIAATLLCLIYSLITWIRGRKAAKEEIPEREAWGREHKALEEGLP